MPRKLIIGIFVVLILGIIGGTVVVVMQRLRGNETSPTPSATPSGSALNPAQPGQQTVTDPNADDDNDGLPNAQEILWGTNASNPDTDGDGYRDGEEVANRYNPTIPSPGDKLAADFVPGQAPTTDPSAPPQVDQYFEDDIDLNPIKSNASEQYKNRYPEAQRTADTLATFVAEQPIVTKLPTVKATAFTTIPNAGPASMKEYLAAVGSLGAISNSQQLAQGLSEIYATGDTATIVLMASQLRYYQNQLVTTSVPTQALSFHRLLVGYTQLLAATFDQIAVWNDDAVKAMVGVRQLEAIDRQYYPVLQQEHTRLTSQAGS